MVEVVVGLLDEVDLVSCICVEVEQEVGVCLCVVQLLFGVYMSLGLVMEKLYFFVVEYEECDLVGEGGGFVDEGEDIVCFEFGFDDVMCQVEVGEIVDVKMILLMCWVECYVFGFLL